MQVSCKVCTSTTEKCFLLKKMYDAIICLDQYMLYSSSSGNFTIALVVVVLDLLPLHKKLESKQRQVAIISFAFLPVCTAYHHLPDQQRVTSSPLISLPPTSTLPLAQGHILCYYFCRKRFVSLHFTACLTNGTKSERFRPQHIEGRVFWNSMDFTWRLRKPCPWTHKASI